MNTFKRTTVANEWHRVFIFLPRRIINLKSVGDKRVVESRWYFLCNVERRFSVTKGTFSGIEYRSISKYQHERCPTNCGQFGCTAPLADLSIARLRKNESASIPIKKRVVSHSSDTLRLSDIAKQAK